jgi:hypothetical protein
MSYIGKTPTSVPLTSSDITDGIISLPKLTDGTDGNLISYDASGNPVAVATGTDGQVLTSTGAGSPPAFEALPAGGTNTPAFDARASTNQTGLSSGGWTKVQFDTELFDTDSAYDNATDKFTVPSDKAGKYFFTTFAKINGATSYGLMATGMRITVNGTIRKQAINFAKNTAPTIYAEGKGVNCVLDLSVSDYVEVYAYYQDVNGTAGSITGSADMDTFFSGYKLIE